eukprot:7162407-Lingulodinium_polyedra.AAC.1
MARRQGTGAARCALLLKAAERAPLFSHFRRNSRTARACLPAVAKGNASSPPPAARWSAAA